MKEAALSRALTWIELGPVVLVTTHGERDNVMTVSWTMALDFAGHVAFATGPWNYSYFALRRTGECALCIPPASMAQTVVDIGMVSGEEEDKFRKFSLCTFPAAHIGAPLLSDCLACLECRVCDFLDKYGIFVLEVLRVTESEDAPDRRLLHAVGDGTFFADGERFDLRARMRAKLPPGL